MPNRQTRIDIGAAEAADRSATADRERDLVALLEELLLELRHLNLQMTSITGMAPRE